MLCTVIAETAQFSAIFTHLPVGSANFRSFSILGRCNIDRTVSNGYKYVFFIKYKSVPMIKNLSLFGCFFFSAVFYCTAQNPAPVMKWQKTLGGSSDELIGRPTKISTADRDGGYLIGGITGSTDGDVSGLHYTGGWPESDIWIAKLDAQKNISWSKCLGGTSWEEFGALELAHDDGYIVAGGANSTNGQVTGMHGDGDAWIVRLDNTGNVVWQKCYGGSKNENAMCIAKTDDGYIFVGTTWGSKDGDVSGSHGTENRDIWLVKIDKDGNKLWQKCLGGSSWDVPTDIKVTPDGGFILTGLTTSIDGDVAGVHYIPNPPYDDRYPDTWVVKLNSNGIIEWQKCLGGSNEDGSSAVALTASGGYLISGYTKSKDGDVSGQHVTDPAVEDSDAWVVNLSATGNIIWQKCFGGTQTDEFNDFIILPDQSVVAVGITHSPDGDVSYLYGDRDCWLVKFDNTGNIIWEKTFGTTGYEDATTLSLTTTGNFVVAGTNLDDNTLQNLWLFEAGVDSPVPGGLRISPNTGSLINRAEVVSSVYPNPGNGNVTLRLQGAVQGNVLVQVLDQQGRLVTTKQFGEQHTAEFKTPLDLGKLSKGSYILRITVSDKTSMHKLLIQ